MRSGAARRGWHGPPINRGGEPSTAAATAVALRTPLSPRPPSGALGRHMGLADVVRIHPGQMHGRGHGNADKASTDARETVGPRTYVRLVHRTAGQKLLGGGLVDWVRTPPVAEARLPLAWLSRQQKAAELERIQRDRAMQTAR